MAKLYTNENLGFKVVVILRELNHDVLTSLEAGKANKGIPDEQVLAFAHSQKRIVVTLNYQDFKRLHHLDSNHSGIIICKRDEDLFALAHRIHDAIETANGILENQLIRIIRQNPSQKN